MNKKETDNKVNVNGLDDMDKAIPSGKYILPSGKPPNIKLRDMYKYCAEIGKEPSELTNEEMQRFFY
ncbi:hypothetical protein [Bacillus sp. AFS040349]|uniref:hypothetical protein n=1 Tax=Bacillus sp. AFS040349 TaxID=2033502 RepID=UPI000BFCF2BA|nr:hypothetical protein [Bacillus sp. AFS040349]PGT80569.1 hypothetical protein COD11_20885 [Bacillus sp. AFS040349]